VAVAVPPGCRIDDKSLMTNPIIPMAPMPKKHIFTDSQSSLFPGFTANFNVLAAWDRNDLKPIFIAHSTF
jgi:hypothetical protein